MDSLDLDKLEDAITIDLLVSKTSTGRQQLIESGELSRVCSQGVSLLRKWEIDLLAGTQGHNETELLLLLLRVLRNTCAAGQAAAAVIQEHDVHTRALQVAVAIAQAQVAPTAVKQQEHSTVAACQKTDQQQQPDQQQQQQQDKKRPPHQVLLTAMQLLANLSVASGQCAASLWEALFPDKLQTILSVPQVDVHEAVALTALSCVRTSPTALADLTSPAAQTIWLQFLAPVMTAAPTSSSSSQGQPADAEAAAAAVSAASAVGTSGNDNLCLLVNAVALQFDCLQQLMDCVHISHDDLEATGEHPHSSSSSCSSAATTAAQSSKQADGCLANFRPNVAHAVLLHILSLEVGAIPVGPQYNITPGSSREPSAAGAAPPPAAPAAVPKCSGQAADQQQVVAAEDCRVWLCYIVKLLRTVSSQALDSARGPNTVAAYVLEATLQVLKAVLAREDAGRAVLRCSQPEYANTAPAAAVAAEDQAADCVMQLHSLGLLQLLLGLLQQLGPPPKARHQQQEQPAAPAQPPPYAGYRADLIAVLSNMLYERRLIQNEILAAGGVELLLNNCNLDDTAPLAREWALWCIRNMCKDNAEVQEYIRKFKAVEAVQNRELERMGKELQLDKLTNKLTLVDKQPQQQEGGGS